MWEGGRCRPPSRGNIMSAEPRLALIDDDRNWAEALAEYLGTHGIDVRLADNGRRGLALLEETGIGVAVVDHNMPEMDGLELLRQLRLRRASVTVFLVSGDDE